MPGRENYLLLDNAVRAASVNVWAFGPSDPYFILVYADNIGVIGETRANVKENFVKIEEAKRIGLPINEENSKYTKVHLYIFCLLSQFQTTIASNRVQDIFRYHK